MKAKRSKKEKDAGRPPAATDARSLVGNNRKRCCSSETNAMWTEGLNPCMFSALCSVKRRKKKEKKKVISATCVVIQKHLWKADIGRPTYQSDCTVLSHCCPFINKVYF